MSKVVPITGAHTSVNSMLAEVMADESAAAVYVIWFDENGVMNAGHYGGTLANTCMAASWLNRQAVNGMGFDE